MFGEAMPVGETREAEARARAADCFIVVGSSLVVHPAAMMPVYAKQSGAALVIVNLSDTPQDAYADLVIRGKAGPVMDGIVSRVKRRLAG
jgi:NAD-dependent deacetylase